MIAFAELQGNANENDEHESCDAIIDKSNLLFDQKWDDIVEMFVKKRVVDIFPDRGIKFTTHSCSARHVQRRIAERWCEIDMILFSSDTTIAIAIQPTLDRDEVDVFIRNMELFRKVGFPPYMVNENIWGAVAYIRGKPEAVQYAQENGLFTILATGKSATIVNANNFEPQKWGAIPSPVGTDFL